MAVATYNAQVAKVNQQRQLGANGVYQMAETVASAPDGAAFDTFNRINPQAAAALKAAHPSDDPEQLDADARLLAQHTGIAVHHYTGRDTDFQNGVLVDKKDGKPVLGSEQVLTGLGGEGKATAFKDGKELVTVHNSDGTDSQIPRWQQAERLIRLSRMSSPLIKPRAQRPTAQRLRRQRLKETPQLLPHLLSL